MKLMELEATLSLDTTGFDTGVKSAKDELSGMGDQFTQLQNDANETSGILQDALGHALGDFLSSMTEEMIEAAFEFARSSLGIASSMEEVQNVVDTTFGGDAGKIKAWARTTTEAYGLGELAALNFSGTMGAVLNGLGIESSKLDDMSMALVGLAGDMASFYNLDSATAFQKILSGMTGEMEPLKQLGIVMSVANLEAHAMAMGIETAWASMDTATQTLVRYDYLMQQTANAQGDFAKTQDSYANQMRLLEENITSLQLALGEKLIPVMTDIVSFFNSIFGGSESSAEAISNVGSAFGETYAQIDTTTANALALVEALSAMEAAGISNNEEQTAWNALLDELASTLPGIDSLINTTTGTIQGGTAALKQYAEQWQATQQEIAVASALQEAQNEVTNRQTAMLKKQQELRMATLTDQDTESRQMQLIDQFGAYLTEYHGWDAASISDNRAAVMFEAYDRAESGDAYASYIVAKLEELSQSDERIEQLNSELLAAQAQLADAQAQYEALYSSLEYLTGGGMTPPDELTTQEETTAETAREVAEAVGEEVAEAVEETKTTKKTETGLQSYEQTGVATEPQSSADVMGALQSLVAALANIKADVAAGAREGCVAGVGSISVTGHITTGNVMLNTGALVGQLTPRLNLALGSTS